jgi:hypothetical protein
LALAQERVLWAFLFPFPGQERRSAMKPFVERVPAVEKDFAKVVKDRATDRWITPSWAAKKGGK